MMQFSIINSERFSMISVLCVCFVCVCGCMCVCNPQRPSVANDTMLYESTEQHFSLRKDKMSVITVSNSVRNCKFIWQLKGIARRMFWGVRVLACICLCVCVGGAGRVERQLPSLHRSSDGCTTNHSCRDSQPCFQLHHCSLLQVVQVHPFQMIPSHFIYQSVIVFSSFCNVL